MNKIKNFFLLCAFVLVFDCKAAYIKYDGETQATDLTAIPFVAGSTMWGAIDTGSGTGTEVFGLTSLSEGNGFEIDKLTLTFGDLELTDYLSPTPTTSGFEYYSEVGDGPAVPLEFYYDNNLWATADLHSIRIDVDNSNDINAVGSASATLTSSTVAGLDFYNEILGLTGGTGNLDFEIDSFYPVDLNGKFGSTATITFPSVPEFGSTIAFLSLGIAGLGFVKRKRNYS